MALMHASNFFIKLKKIQAKIAIIEEIAFKKGYIQIKTFKYFKFNENKYGIYLLELTNEYKKTKIKDLLLIENLVHSDYRGNFSEILEKLEKF